MRRFIILLAILLAMTSSAFSQAPGYIQYAVEHGIPGGTVYHSIQDKDGYIWFATNQGVSRFDGHSFKNFSKEDGLPDNEIIKLYLDSKNNLWFLTMAGIPAVYINGKIISFPACENISAVAEDIPSNKLYLLSASITAFGYYESPNISGKWKFERKIKEITHKRSIYNWPILRYTNQEGFRVYFSFNEKFIKCILYKKGMSRTYQSAYLTHTFIPPFTGQSYFNISQTSESLVYHTIDSIYYCSADAFKPVQSLRSLLLNTDQSHDISSLFIENDRRLWIATRNHGLISITNFLTDNRKIEYYFPNSFCTSIMKDREGGYWVTTHNDGIYYIPNLNFRTISTYPDIGRKDVKSIKATGTETVTAGFADGNIVTINTGNFVSRRHEKWGASNKNNRVLDVYPFDKNSILLATDKGVFKITGNEKTERMNLHYSAAKSVFVDEGKTIFVATATAVERLKGDNNNQAIWGHRATCITGMGNRYYWGTLKGLFVYADNVATNLGARYKELSGIINHIDIAPDSSIWVSTQQGTVIMKNEKIYRLRKTDGLLSNTCKHILFDNNTAWISTDHGISRVVYSWKGGIPFFTISNITEADGLISNDVNQSTLSNNYIWVATSRGISSFPKSFTSSSAYDPIININSIAIGTKETEVKDTIYTKSQENLSIQLSGISYRSGKELQYEYRFSNRDKRWKQLGNNKLEFPALTFGIFNLEVRAIDRWGKKTAIPKRLIIINRAPFWMTDWFLAATYILTVLIIALSVYGYSRFRQNKREKEIQQKRRILELETMAFRAQINPHFIFNCLSSIQHHILKSDPVSANLYLHKLSTLIRKTLQSSANPTILLSEEIAIIKVYLELQKLRLEDRLEYAINLSEDLLISDVRIPSMIIQPFVENAIKHGIPPDENNKGYIRINFRKAGQMIDCVIEDNGIGINASKVINQKSTYPAMGSSITERRIQAINKMSDDTVMLKIQDKKHLDPAEEGTIVKITFIVKSEPA